MSGFHVPNMCFVFSVFSSLLILTATCWSWHCRSKFTDEEIETSEFKTPTRWQVAKLRFWLSQSHPLMLPLLSETHTAVFLQATLESWSEQPYPPACPPFWSSSAAINFWLKTGRSRAFFFLIVLPIVSVLQEANLGMFLLREDSPTPCSLIAL